MKHHPFIFLRKTYGSLIVFVFWLVQALGYLRTKFVYALRSRCA